MQLVDTFGNPGAISTSEQAIGLSTSSTAGTFYATQGSINPITSVGIPAGESSASFYYGDTKASTPTVTAADTAFNSAPTQQETVNAAVAQDLAVTTTFANPDVAGTAGTVTVTAMDTTYGNVVGSGPNQYEHTVEPRQHRHSRGGPTGQLYLHRRRRRIAHLHQHPRLKTAGSQTITATDSVTSTITGSATVNVVPATVQGFVVTTSFANPDVAGTAGSVTVTATDHSRQHRGQWPEPVCGQGEPQQHRRPGGGPPGQPHFHGN